MYTVLQKILNRAASRLAVDFGLARRHFESQRGRIRILTYHGIIPDEMVDRPWVPSQAVSVSQFERQMQLLAELGPARSLKGALQQIADDDQAPPAVCITFDDGLADNATLALPILQKYGHRATFFITTGYIGPDRYLPNDMIRLFRPLYMADPLGYFDEILDDIFTEPWRAKTYRQTSYLPQLEELWDDQFLAIDASGKAVLQMMTWDQVRQLQQAGMEVVAHTVNHVILTREPRRNRRNEIVESVARVQAKTGVSSVPFAFPNGQADDYDSFDVDLLGAVGVPYSVTEHAGWNDSKTPKLELKRQCIGLHCSDHAFLSLVFGVNELMSPSN